MLSKELDVIGAALATNKVPGAWEARAYPSLKPLGAWVTDLVERLDFLGAWVAKGPPPVFWISGFFFPQAFLTGQLQNVARARKQAIDTLSYEPVWMSHRPLDSFKAKPDEGCYVTGIFLEGARFDEDTGALADSTPKTLYELLPVLYFRPQQYRVRPTSGNYELPIYKVLSRWGVLATTGHSSNFGEPPGRRARARPVAGRHQLARPRARRAASSPRPPARPPPLPPPLPSPLDPPLVVMWLQIPHGLGPSGDALNNDKIPDAPKWVRAGVAGFLSLRF